MNIPNKSIRDVDQNAPGRLMRRVGWMQMGGRALPTGQSFTKPSVSSGNDGNVCFLLAKGFSCPVGITHKLVLRLMRVLDVCGFIRPAVLNRQEDTTVSRTHRLRPVEMSRPIKLITYSKFGDSVSTTCLRLTKQFYETG